jgi:glutamate-ammonia-ligase adenylyltransferase
VIYDAAGVETSDGPRELPVRTYYTRLTQALITALSAPMAEGRLYEVDMRLRPSGNQGPVATSWSAFRTYQAEDAWTWEHLALTRARVVAGPEALGQDVEAFRRELISRPRDKAALARDVADMRERIAAAKPPASWLDIKAGPGRMQDIELLAQAGQLLDGSPESDAAKGLSAGLEALRRLGALSAPEDLVAAHALQWRVHAALRLLGTEGGDPDALGGNARDFLLRLGEAESLADLQSDLERATSLAEAAVGAALDHLGKGAADGGEG